MEEIEMNDLISRRAVLEFVQGIKDNINDNKCFGDNTRKVNMGDLQDILVFVEHLSVAYDVATVKEQMQAKCNLYPSKHHPENIAIRAVPIDVALNLVERGGV